MRASFVIAFALAVTAPALGRLSAHPRDFGSHYRRDIDPVYGHGGHVRHDRHSHASREDVLELFRRALDWDSVAGNGVYATRNVQAGFDDEFIRRRSGLKSDSHDSTKSDGAKPDSDSSADATVTTAEGSNKNADTTGGGDDRDNSYYDILESYYPHPGETE